jgi:hypothetical protein
MSTDGKTSFSDADITSTAGKMAAFAETLTEGERAVLARVVTLAAQAGQAEGEVQGYFTLIEFTGNLLTHQSLRGALFQAAGMGDGSVRPQAGGTLGAVNVPAVQAGATSKIVIQGG